MIVLQLLHPAGVLCPPSHPKDIMDENFASAFIDGISHLDIKFSTTEKSKHTLITLGQCARPSLDNDCNTKMRPIKVRWFKQYWGHLMTIAWLEAICRRVPRMPRILPNPAAPVGTFLLQCQLIRFFRSSTRSRKSKPNTCILAIVLYPCPHTPAGAIAAPWEMQYNVKLFWANHAATQGMGVMRKNLQKCALNNSYKNT